VQAAVQHFYDDTLALLLFDLCVVPVLRQETVKADVVDENMRADKVKKKE
jgi:hypothetical protein